MKRALVVSVVFASFAIASGASAQQRYPTQVYPPPAPQYPPPQYPAPQPAADPARTMAVELTSLRLMREKNLISQAEYESALHDLAESTGTQASEAHALVVGKWSTVMYGFIEADSIYDTTRSFAESAGNGQVSHNGTLAGNEGRFQMSVRNSRIGFRMGAPEYHGIRTSAQLEMDFLGTQLPIGSGATGSGTGTEAAFYTNPTFRIRHFNVKIETPIVDVLAGQYWQLFGWQSAYHPNTVEIQGVPGQLYSRTPQIRVSKTMKSDAITVEAAIAATRPVDRDGSLPDGQGGLRLALNKWQTVQTNGATGTTTSPLSVAVTGYMRNVHVDQFAAAPKFTNDKLATGIAVDGFVPIISATKEHRNNALSLSGELASGYGDADMYTGLTGGVGFPALPNPTNANPAPTYTQNIDNGIVTYDPGGKLHFIQWTSYIFGLQYYLPVADGKTWVSINYSHMESTNTGDFNVAATSKLRQGIDWYDANLFVDITPALRVGGEVALFDDQYLDGTHNKNYRYQGSVFYIF